MFLIFQFKLKFPSPAVFYCNQYAEYSALGRVLYKGTPPPKKCFMHADAFHVAETSNLNNTINFTET